MLKYILPALVDLSVCQTLVEVDFVQNVSQLSLSRKGHFYLTKIFAVSDSICSVPWIVKHTNLIWLLYCTPKILLELANIFVVTRSHMAANFKVSEQRQ